MGCCFPLQQLLNQPFHWENSASEEARGSTLKAQGRFLWGRGGARLERVMWPTGQCQANPPVVDPQCEHGFLLVLPLQSSFHMDKRSGPRQGYVLCMNLLLAPSPLIPSQEGRRRKAVKLAHFFFSLSSDFSFPGSCHYTASVYPCLACWLLRRHLRWSQHPGPKAQMRNYCLHHEPGCMGMGDECLMSKEPGTYSC